MSFIDELEGLILNKIGLIKSLISITKLEGQLASLSVLPLIVCVVALFAVLINIWLSTSLIVGYLLWLYFNNITYSLIVVLVLNIIILLILKQRLLSNLHKMSFTKTRQYFDNVLTVKGTAKHECAPQNSNGAVELGKDVTSSTE